MRIQIIIFTMALGVAISGRAMADDVMPNMVGMGAVVRTSPYAGVKSNVMAIPLGSWKYKGFYIKGLEAGFTLYDQNGLKLGLLTTPRFMGYSSDDSTALNGMEDRRASLDAGFKAAVDVPWVKGLSVNAQVLNDVLARYHGREGSFSLEQAYGFKLGYCRFSAGVKVQSRRLTDYYYGVLPNEVRVDRPAYSPGTAVDPFAGVLLITGLPLKWRILARTGVEWLDPSIRKSPIVKDSYSLMGMLGFVREF